MSLNPPISVVMSVRNDVAHVERSVLSIRNQTRDDFEFLIIDDGSTDGTLEILKHHAAEDLRLRIVTQDRQGLTHSLRRGCAEAKGDFIARQDSGDESQPHRLETSVEVLRKNPGVGFVCGTTEYYGPRGEPLHVTKCFENTPGRYPNIDLGGPGPSHHGATMFRRDLYERVGGYRPVFAMAQDWDLWFRLIEVAEFFALPEPGYRAQVDPWGISMSKRDVQRRFGRLAAECHRARISGQSEQAFLSEAAELSRNLPSSEPRDPTIGLYFIGSLLLTNRNPQARTYLAEAVRRRPWDPKIWLKLLRAMNLFAVRK